VLQPTSEWRAADAVKCHELTAADGAASGRKPKSRQAMATSAIEARPADEKARAEPLLLSH